MKRLAHAIAATVIVLLLSPGSLFAQTQGQGAEDAKRKVLDAVQAAQKDHPGISVKINKKTGLCSSVTGLSPQPKERSSAPRLGSSEVSGDEVRQAAINFFKKGQLGASITPTQQEKADYAVDEAHGVRQDQDIAEQYVVRLTQQADGIPVFGASAKVVVTTKAGAAQVIASAQNFSPLDLPNITHHPAVPREEAITAASEELKRQLEKAPKNSPAQPSRTAPDTAPDAQLVIFDPRLTDVAGTNQRARLAWMVSFGELRFFIDAETKQTLFFYANRHFGFQREVHDLVGKASFNVSAVKDADLRSAHPDVKNAAANLEIAYRFFKTLFKRDSFDDKGGKIEAFTRHSNDTNAYWCPNISQDCPKRDVLVFGPGWTVLDIAGHEFSHGVIEYSAKLLYANEPGAVNESLADIFGVLMKLENGGAKWIIGDQLPEHSEKAPLRDLSNPHMGVFRKDKYTVGQPETYDELLKPSDPACAILWFSDNGCVHLNSGILNRAAYLMSEGGQQGGLTITAIGRRKLARLTYRVLTVKLVESSTMIDAATGYRDACDELKSPSGGFTAADCEQVDRALTSLHLSPEA
jgi:Zn-dependent metalloprotease